MSVFLFRFSLSSNGEVINTSGDIRAQVSLYSNNYSVLTKLVSHENVYVRECAINQFRTIEPDKAIEYLLSLATLATSTQDEGYKAIGNTLLALEYDPGEDIIQTMLLSSNKALRWFSVGAVWRYKLYNIKDTLLDVADKCPDSSTARNATMYLIHMGVPSNSFDRIYGIATTPDSERWWMFNHLLTSFTDSDKVAEHFESLLTSSEAEHWELAIAYYRRAGITSENVLTRLFDIAEQGNTGIKHSVFRLFSDSTKNTNIEGLGYPCIIRSPDKQKILEESILLRWREWFEANEYDFSKDE